MKKTDEKKEQAGKQDSGEQRVFQLITSLQNTHVKEIVKLYKRSYRDQRKLVVVEGNNELSMAVANRRWPVSLFYCEAFSSNEHANKLIELCVKHNTRIFKCTRKVFEKITYQQNPDGLLTLIPQINSSLSEIKLSRQPLVIVAEAIEKPGNLGAILRSADAAGADAVIICDQCTDVNNPNVVRASIGTLFSVPIAQASSRETIIWLKQHGIQIIAAMPQAEKVYTQTDLTCATAIVVGAEKPGLSSLWRRETDYQVCIPMRGQADSLNVASATAIILFEAMRQRAAKKKT